MGRHPIGEEASIKRTIYFPEEDWCEVVEKAEELEISASQLIRDAVEFYLEVNFP